ncbi:TasA family protein [Rossellomorea oryzaecorticis]|uniref:TasA family protein n=1 Tax=Rossellomorea oryzaecorticis TaxID=1396505 RepID=A0ABU9K5B1_9BACI
MKHFFGKVIILFIAFLIFSPNIYQAEQDHYIEQKELDISTSPHKIFFNISNLKPGDKITKQLTVLNKGTQDFTYLFTNKFITGSGKFYNELRLEVSDNKGSLFKGKLKDFHKLESRELKTSSSEILIFTVEVPFELGNDFQGLNSEFQFKVFVEGTLGGVLPVDGPKLPVTGTEYYKILLLGVAVFTSGVTLYFYSKKRRSDILKVYKEVK